MNRRRRAVPAAVLSAGLLALLQGCSTQPDSTGTEVAEPSTPSGGGGSRGEEPRSGRLDSTAGPGLHFTVLGEGEPTVVVPLGFLLEPAFGGRPELLEGRRFVFYDPRNRGRSEAVGEGEGVSLADDVADLERLRVELGIERMALIGFSLYAKMVTIYALEHPERVTRIVQLGPPGRVFGAIYPPHLQAADRVEAMGREAMMEVRRLQMEGLDEERPREYCEREWEVTRRALVGDPSAAERLPSPCEYEREWPLYLYRHFERALASGRVDPGVEALAGLTLPVLTIHGTRDRSAPYGAGRQWAVELGNARLMTLEGAAHATWVERPEVVFPAIDTFLDGDWPDGAEAIDRVDPRVDPDAEV